MSWLLQRLRDWRQRRKWAAMHLEWLRTMVYGDARWLASNPIASALTQRYEAALRDDWYALDHEDTPRLRTRLGLDPSRATGGGEAACLNKISIVMDSNMTPEERSALIDAFSAKYAGAKAGIFQPLQPTLHAGEPVDEDGKAFRAAARLGLTLRFYGGCAQSGMPGSPSAYEVVPGQDRAAAMREAIERAQAVIAGGGEPQRLSEAQAQASQTAKDAKQFADALENDGWIPFHPSDRRALAAVLHSIAAPPLATLSASEPVYLVATGEVVDGRETYTRHEGAPPPLSDFERLYAAPGAWGCKQP